MREVPKNVAPLRSGQSTGSDGGGGDYGERLARIEAKLEHMATREDIKAETNKMLVWFIGLLFAILGVLASMLFKLLALLPA